MQRRVEIAIFGDETTVPAQVQRQIRILIAGRLSKVCLAKLIDVNAPRTARLFEGLTGKKSALVRPSGRQKLLSSNEKRRPMQFRSVFSF